MLGGYTITATAILGISRTIKEEIITIYRQPMERSLLMKYNFWGSNQCGFYLFWYQWCTTFNSITKSFCYRFSNYKSSFRELCVWCLLSLDYCCIYYKRKTNIRAQRRRYYLHYKFTLTKLCSRTHKRSAHLYLDRWKW